MEKKILLIFIVLLCAKISINAQHISIDSLRIPKQEVVTAQVAKLAHELGLTKEQQRQAYNVLMRAANNKNTPDNNLTFDHDLMKLLTSKQKQRFYKLREWDKQNSIDKNTPSLKSVATAQYTLTLNDTAVIKDVQLIKNNYPGNENWANKNYKTATRLCAHAWTFHGYPMYRRTVMKFILDAIPANSQIVSALLYFYSDPTITSPSSANGNSQLSGSNEFYIEKITENWGENTVTWNNQPASTVTDRILVPASTSTTENIQIDITDMVQQWVNQPDSNYGFKMFLKTEARYRARNYGSTDHPNTAIHPKLVIEYNGPSFKFTYDDSGNRTDRNVIILANNLKSAKSTSINIEKPELEKPIVSSIGGFTITLFPNPTQGDVSLKLSGDSIPERIIYKVFNAGGSMVCNGLLNSSTLQKVPLASQPMGIYILMVQYGDKTKTWKIIKK